MDGELSGEDLLTDLQKWVSAEALKLDNIQKYDLKIYGGDKAENCGSDIAFVDISAENFNGERREYNLVIKYSTRKRSSKGQMPARSSFERETDIYTKIIPCYHKLQQEKNLPLFAYAPKCYLTKLTDTENVIILENLKQIGYRIYDKKQTMGINHMELVLEAYAEWHALSFALVDQKNEEYLEMIAGWTRYPTADFIFNDSGKTIDVSQQFLYEVLSDRGEIELLQKYKEKIGNKTSRAVMMDLLNQQEPQSVVLHGDGWNNNFMFKYEDDELTEKRATKVAMLDFQLCYVHSPVFDLSYFIYAVASEAAFKHFKELLDHYYQHFANHLEALGSNPEMIFSYSDLIRHFQKYSPYGALTNPSITLYAMAEKENDSDSVQEHSLDELKKVMEKEEYLRRILCAAKHFVEYEY